MPPTASALTLERLVRRDRWIALLGLSLITLIAWAYLVRMAGGMAAAASEQEMHAAMGMATTASWALPELLALFAMWAVMMAGMMLPSAAPVILMVVGVYRRRGGPLTGSCSTVFATGYLVAWTGFSAVAAAAQMALHSAALMSASMASRSTALAGAIFLAAGVYQWMPFKNACLAHCRSPLQHLSREWREGLRGAFVMGLRHGLFCVGCCWALMAVLFAAGVMNLLWVAAIAAFVFVEKLLPAGRLVGRFAGALLAVWGGYLLLAPVI